MTRYISLGLLLTFLIVLGWALFEILSPFVLPLVLACVVSMLVQPLFLRCVRWCGQRKSWGAALCTVLLHGGVLVPLLAGTIIGGVQLSYWSAEMFSTEESLNFLNRVHQELDIPQQVARLQPYVAPDITPAELEAQIISNLRENFPKFLGIVGEQTLGVASSTLGLVGSLITLAICLGIFTMALYYFLAEGQEFLATAQLLIPLPRQHQDKLIREFAAVTRAVVIGTFAAAIVQGIATGLGFWVAGFPNIALITILASMAAVVPLAGTWIVWIPCVVWMAFTQENPWTAVIALSLYNLLVVGTLDNVVRTYILNSDVRLHPLLAFVSVLGGLQWLGLWGVFVGPVVAALMQSVIQIFHQELTALCAAEATLAHSQAAPENLAIPAQNPTAQQEPTTSRKSRTSSRSRRNARKRRR